MTPRLSTELCPARRRRPRAFRPARFSNCSKRKRSEALAAIPRHVANSGGESAALADVPKVVAKIWKILGLHKKRQGRQTLRAKILFQSKSRKRVRQAFPNFSLAGLGDFNALQPKKNWKRWKQWKTRFDPVVIVPIQIGRAIRHPFSIVKIIDRTRRGVPSSRGGATALGDGGGE